MERVKLKFIADKKSIYFKKGEIYEGFRANDDRKGRFWCFHIEEDEDPGDYGFPSEWFEVVKE